MTRTPVPATPRRAMTPARRARVISMFGHFCAYPDCQVQTGLEIDHVIALDLGGKDEDANLQPLCPAHHKAKTRLDHKLIAKMRRRQRKSDPATRRGPARKIRGAGFWGWRLFDGSIRRKEA